MYPAHIRETGERQTVREHCRNAAAYAAKALRPIGLGETAYLAALLHDLGKAKEEFSQYLSAAASGSPTAPRGSVNHTFAGVRFILEQWHTSDHLDCPEVTAELLAFAVGAHHGLFDCVDPRHDSGFFHRQTKEGIHYEESVKNYLEECADLEELHRRFRAATEETARIFDRILSLSTAQTDEEADQETAFYVGLLARMLLSAVMEGDRRDTAEYLNLDTFPSWPEDMRGIWSDRLAHMEHLLGDFSHSSPIDLARQSISDQCAAFAHKPGGIYRLNVPTGGGKTLSGLRYALTHAKLWNKSRILFTAPLLSILDQNAAILRRFIGDDQLILEHHSNLVEPEDTPERLRRIDLLTDTYDAPIIITTLVQLLNTCFSGKSSTIRRFHALCDSVIVIDEVQTVPCKLLTLFNLTIKFLSEICGATIVLCSATQPCLNAARHPLYPVPADIVPWQKALWDIFKRTEIQNAGCARLEQLPDRIVEALSGCGSLLVICNTKEEAGFLYHQMKAEDCVCFHLSAAMCPEHRRQALRDLQTALNQISSGGRRVVCISTQVIEAGVDISFQQVIRLTAGMDSVVQAAGRCNRNAEQDTPSPVRIVRCTNERLTFLQDIVCGQTATNALLTAFAAQPDRFQHDLSSDAAIAFYYRKLYADMDAGFQDATTREHGSLYQLLADNPRYADRHCKQASRFYLRQAFRLAGSLFQVFDENTTQILVPYGRGRALRESLLSASQDHGAADWKTIREWIREAKGYSVSVYRYQWEQLRKLGAVTSLFEDSVHVLCDGFYDEATGFSTTNGTSGFQEV